MDENTGKELVLTAPTGIRRRRSKPEFVTVGEGRNARKIARDGRWHPDLIEDHLLEHRRRWVTTGELSKLSFTANTLNGKRKVRKRLSKLISHMLFRGVILITESDGPTGRVQAVKVCDPRSEEDRQGAQARLFKMQQRKEITAEQFERARTILAAAEMIPSEIE